MSAASSFDLPSNADGEDMSLSDLELPNKKRALMPARSSRFTLLAQRDEHDDSNEADESYLDEEPFNEEPVVKLKEQSPSPEAEKPDQSLLPEPPDSADDMEEIVEATPRLTNRIMVPESELPRSIQAEASITRPISEEDRLRQQLLDMQRLNEAFSGYHSAVSAVREKQRVCNK